MKIYKDYAYADSKRKWSRENHKKVRLKVIEKALNNPEEYLLQYIKNSSKTRKQEFNLTIDDIVIPKECPYLGIPIKSYIGTGKIGGGIDSISVDRIDNSKGYVKGNILICSKLGNFMKNKATTEQLITFAKNILKIYNNNEL